MTDQRTQPTDAYVPGGTRVLNTHDGEPGTIMNGFTTDENGHWIEYEVETAEGVERWHREAFILIDELDVE
jgi:hypothetical protein